MGRARDAAWCGGCFGRTPPMRCGSHRHRPCLLGSRHTGCSSACMCRRRGTSHLPRSPPVHDAWMGSAIRQSQAVHFWCCSPLPRHARHAACGCSGHATITIQAVTFDRPGWRTMSRLPGCLPLPSQAVQLAAHDRAPHNLVHEACEGRSNSEKAGPDRNSRPRPEQLLQKFRRSNSRRA